MYSCLHCILHQLWFKLRRHNYDSKFHQFHRLERFRGPDKLSWFHHFRRANIWFQCYCFRWLGYQHRCR